MIPLREKVCGMFLGIGIGENLGLPLRGMNPETIIAKHGQITNYLQPTDQHAITQLALVVANAIIPTGKLDIQSQLMSHLSAFEKSTVGWDKATQAACQWLATAEEPSVARSGQIGEESKKNSCCVKVSPIAVHMVKYIKTNPQWDRHRTYVQQTYEFLRKLSLMTHSSVLAVQSAIAMAVAYTYCLSPFCDFDDGEQFDADQFIYLISEAAAYAMLAVSSSSHPNTIHMDSNLHIDLLKLYDYSRYDMSRCCIEFNNCDDYIVNSLPASCIAFLKSPFKIDALFDIISAGGAADINGAMVGALLGALNGTKIFPSHLIEVSCRDQIISTANQLCDILAIE